MAEEQIVERISIHSLVAFLMETCRVAIECGCSSNRVELLVTRLGEAWGFNVEAAAIPTVVFLSVRGRGQQVFELVRVKKWLINLDRLALLNDLVDQIEHRTVFLDEAAVKLKEISESPSPYPPWLILAAGGGSSVAVVFSSGGRHVELGAAFGLGLVCQGSRHFFATGNRRYLSDFFTSMIVAGTSILMQSIWPTINLPRLIIGGLISLVPGLVFVNAVHEIAQKNLASGSARTLEAFMIATSLAFGVAAMLGIVHYAVRM